MTTTAPEYVTTVSTADRIAVANFNKLEQDYKATLTTDGGVVVGWKGREGVLDFENVAGLLAWAEGEAA